MKKDQHIILCAETPQDAETLLPAAKTLAEGFHKGIILLSCSDGADSWIGSYGVPYVALKGDWKTAIDGLPTVFGGILALALCNPSAPRTSITCPKTLLRTFRDCRIAYLVLPSHPASPLVTASLSLTLDHSRESKEKLIWASYFARFLGTQVRILHHRYTDQALLSRFRNNMRYLDKIFTAQHIPYTPCPMEGTHQLSNPDLHAVTLPADLFLAQTSDPRERDLASLLLPPPERRLLLSGKPLLLLNRRDDLYVLCD